MGRNNLLPPQVSELEFARAIAAIRSAVGADRVYVFDSAEPTRLDPYALGGNHYASARVMPGCREEVQAVVRVAAQYGVPLWPVARGLNLGYGAAAPLMAGSVILDLQLMNRILDVDERDGLCVIEPGVGFIDLFNFLRSNGMALWMSIPGNPNGSILGNALERGIGYGPYGDHVTKLCGLEVVLPNGDVLRTGMGAMANGRCWHHYQPGFGPSWDQMFVQSNFGIVTRAGLWLMPEPESTLRARIQLPAFEDLQWAVNVLAQIRMRNLIEHPIVIGNYLHEAALFSRRNEWYCGEKSLPEDIGRSIMEQHRLGWWNFSLSLFGYPEVILAQAAIIRNLLHDHLPEPISFEAWHRGEPIDRSAACTPNPLGLQVVDWCGPTGAHICFSPVIPPSGELAVDVARHSMRRFEQTGHDYCSAFTIGQRHINNINTILFDRENPEMVQRTRSLFDLLLSDASARGFGEYRTHLEFMKRVAESFDYNDGALHRLNGCLKDALDPTGIIAPGKSGIWPQKYRE